MLRAIRPFTSSVWGGCSVCKTDPDEMTTNYVREMPHVVQENLGRLFCSMVTFNKIQNGCQDGRQKRVYLLLQYISIYEHLYDTNDQLISY